jgi:hypothetical protein
MNAAEAIALLEKWLADESGYDEEAWPRLERAMLDTTCYRCPMCGALTSATERHECGPTYEELRVHLREIVMELVNSARWSRIWKIAAKKHMRRARADNHAFVKLCLTSSRVEEELIAELDAARRWSRAWKQAARRHRWMEKMISLGAQGNRVALSQVITERDALRARLAAALAELGRE